jgi:3-oxoacyl-[acyl-carrier-protein] synthase III
MTRAAIIGTGLYVPPRVITNEDLAGIIDTSDEWITERSGIKERRWLDVDADGWTVESGAEMGAAAARQAIEAASIEPDAIDQVIYATLNPDCFFPGNGVFIEELLGLNTAGAMDIRNQCTGFIYGLAAADGFIRAGTAKTVLVIGGEVQSTALDRTDRGRDMTVLFGDGAGAAVVQACDEDRGIIASVLHSQGRFARDLWCEAPVGNRTERINQDMIDEARHFPKMDGPLVFKHATRRFCESIKEVLAKGEMSTEDLDLLVPHQANQRITDAVGQRMGLEPERVFSNIARYGNTTAATIPIALAEAEREGRLKRGDVVVTVAFGSGFTWGANLIRW